LKDSYLRAPKRDKEEPVEGTYQSKAEGWTWNENEWVNELYKELTE
jgi:hypothetical protein